MPLAQGTVPGTQAPIYTAPPGGKTITSIEVANDSTGTGTCTLNLLIRRKGRDPVRVIPKDSQLGIDEILEEDTTYRLGEGDQIEAASTDSDSLKFTIEGG